MLEKIKKTVFQKYNKTDTRGVFVSGFDKTNKMIISSGVLYTDKSIEELIETLFHGLIEKHNNIAYIIIDIVTETVDVNNIGEIQSISLKDYGILISTENKSGVILPNTKGIENIQETIQIIKEKNGLTGNAKIIKFKTDRLMIN